MRKKRTVKIVGDIRKKHPSIMSRKELIAYAESFALQTTMVVDHKMGHHSFNYEKFKTKDILEHVLKHSKDITQ